MGSFPGSKTYRQQHDEVVKQIKKKEPTENDKAVGEAIKRLK